jgi:hypothetical protein
MAWIGEEYRPEPDVLVMDADYELRQRYVERAYVFAGIISDADKNEATGRKSRGSPSSGVSIRPSRRSS